MSWANFAQLMKIASVGLQAAGQATGNKYLIAAGGVTAGAGTAAGGAATMQADAANTTTPSPKPVAPPKPTPGPTVPKSKIQAQQAAGGITNVPKPQAELLKVNPEVKPGGYTKTGLQEAYLKGLEQSGAKLDNKGQIVKQSGEPYKKVGWDRKAQLMGGRRTPDRLHRLRMLAIDRANIGAKDVKPPGETNVMNISEPKTPRQDKLKPVPIKIEEFNPTSDKPTQPATTNTGYNPKLTKKEIKKRVTKDEYGNIFHLDDDGVWRPEKRDELLW